MFGLILLIIIIIALYSAAVTDLEGRSSTYYMLIGALSMVVFHMIIANTDAGQKFMCNTPKEAKSAPIMPTPPTESPVDPNTDSNANPIHEETGKLQKQVDREGTKPKALV